jgi:hypothetical protein
MENRPTAEKQRWKLTNAKEEKLEQKFWCGLRNNTKETVHVSVFKEASKNFTFVVLFIKTAITTA